MLPVPIDWAVEIEPPATFYQECLPKAFRYINTVTDISQETVGVCNDTAPPTTDRWETAHFQSMTGEWEDEAGILKATGFESVFLAEDIRQFKEQNGSDTQFPSIFGYYDEGIT